MKSLGVDPTTEESKTAILSEAGHILCKINAQYQYMISVYSDSIKTGDPLSKTIFQQIQEKNQMMRDIIGISRHIMDMPSDSNKMIEGFQGTTSNSNNDVLNQLNSIDNGLKGFGARNYELSNEKNDSMNAYLNMYSFMNVVAVGLLFYIATATPR
jgi:hypothetical protein